MNAAHVAMSGDSGVPIFWIAVTAVANVLLALFALLSIMAQSSGFLET
jgi:ABC-type phosphate transport system auxiliary subunit